MHHYTPNECRTSNANAFFCLFSQHGPCLLLFFFQVHLACPKGNSGTPPSPPRTAARAAPPLPSGAADQRVAWSPRHVHFSFSQIPGTQLLSLPQCIKYTHHSPARHPSSCTENDSAAKLEFFNTHNCQNPKTETIFLFCTHGCAPEGTSGGHLMPGFAVLIHSKE